MCAAMGGEATRNQRWRWQETETPGLQGEKRVPVGGHNAQEVVQQAQGGSARQGRPGLHVRAQGAQRHLMQRRMRRRAQHRLTLQKGLRLETRRFLFFSLQRGSLLCLVLPCAVFDTSRLIPPGSVVKLRHGCREIKGLSRTDVA